MAITTEAAAARIIDTLAKVSPITGNDLQRALLACQIEHMRTTHTMLFQVPFIMWESAPCDVATFQRYSVYGNVPIPKADYNGPNELPRDAAETISNVCARIAASESAALMIWYMTEVIPHAGGYHALDMEKTKELADSGFIFKG